MATVQNVKDRSIDEAPVLGEEELHTIKQRMEVIDKLFAQEQKAKYKIELMFGSTRTMADPTPGAISFWESGAKLHGGGDTKMYICAGKTSGKSDCESFIPDVSNGYGYLLCPKCKTVWKGGEVAGEILAKLQMQDWAHLLLKYFAKLEHNADIYIKHTRNDIRKVATLEQLKELRGSQLSIARTSRLPVIYPLYNIVKDVSNGSDLLGRFYSLLKA